MFDLPGDLTFLAEKQLQSEKTVIETIVDEFFSRNPDDANDAAEEQADRAESDAIEAYFTEAQ